MKNPGYIWQKKNDKNFIPKGKSSSQNRLLPADKAPPALQKCLRNLHYLP